jgi:hypothetical protein
MIASGTTVRTSIKPAARALADTGDTVGVADFFGVGRSDDVWLGVDEAVGAGLGTADASGVEDA